VRKRYLYRLFASPLTWVPAVAGFTAATALWAADKAAAAVFALVCGAAVALGSLYSRVLMGDARRQAEEDVAAEENKARETELDKLDRGLARADDDARTETALRGLRALYRTLANRSAWKRKIDDFSAVKILDKARENFDQAVASLRLTLDLRRCSANAPTEGVRAAIEERREAVVLSVQEIVRKFEAAVTFVLTDGSGGAEDGLTQVGREFDLTLEAARSAGERLDSLKTGAGRLEDGPT
jgi:hypothetical protein